MKHFLIDLPQNLPMLILAIILVVLSWLIGFGSWIKGD